MNTQIKPILKIFLTVKLFNKKENLFLCSSSHFELIHLTVCWVASSTSLTREGFCKKKTKEPEIKDQLSLVFTLEQKDSKIYSN